MKKDRATYLYGKYIKNDLNDNERLEWEYLGLDPDNDLVFQELVDGFWQSSSDDLPVMNADHASRMKQYILRQPQPEIPEKKIAYVRFWPKIAVAAAIAILILSTWLLFYNKSNEIKPADHFLAYKNDIAPGKVGATLTLANGRKIRLGDAANGEIAKETGIKVSKTADGQIIYEITASEALTGNPGATNTLTTAKGETYVLTLPDKSKVWMNASSSLTYYTGLKQHYQRKVMLEGEAYFQVAKDKAHPFIVESRNQVLEVLGTHFNVNSYSDERTVKTTLLEGCVKVNGRAGSGAPMKDVERILKPGQQSELDDKYIIEVAEVNVEDALDWKSGDFNFNGEGVQSIMRKLSRWYNVEVIYEGRFSTERYYGKVSRSKNIGVVLKMLEKSQGVHFKIDGRRVTVLE